MKAEFSLVRAEEPMASQFPTGIFSKIGRKGKKCQGGVHPVSIWAVTFSLIAVECKVGRLFKHAEHSVLTLLAQ